MENWRYQKLEGCFIIFYFVGKKYGINKMLKWKNKESRKWYKKGRFLTITDWIGKKRKENKEHRTNKNRECCDGLFVTWQQEKQHNGRDAISISFNFSIKDWHDGWWWFVRKGWRSPSALWPSPIFLRFFFLTHWMALDLKGEDFFCWAIGSWNCFVKGD